MAYKKIEIANCNYCPACKGRKGVEFHQNAQVKYTAKWGRNFDQFKAEKFSDVPKPPKTAYCTDCLKRYIIT